MKRFEDGSCVPNLLSDGAERRTGICVGGVDEGTMGGVVVIDECLGSVCSGRGTTGMVESVMP